MNYFICYILLLAVVSLELIIHAKVKSEKGKTLTLIYTCNIAVVIILTIIANGYLHEHMGSTLINVIMTTIITVTIYYFCIDGYKIFCHIKRGSQHG